MKNLVVTSPAFENGKAIPVEYARDGDNVSPPLQIEGIPENASSLVLIVDDTETSRGTWNHWVVWNIPLTARIEEGKAPGVEGINDFKKRSYDGPCPPSGTHKYLFKVYALDVMLNLSSNSREADIISAMEEHILAKGELLGLYTKRERYGEAVWFQRYRFPISLPGEPLDSLSPKFDDLFVRLSIYDELDTYLANIREQHGKFWISSPYGGSGKSTMLSYAARFLYKQITTLRALPFSFAVPKTDYEAGETKSVQHKFIKNFLKEFLRIDSNLMEASKVFQLTLPDNVLKVLELFQSRKDGVRKFEKALVSLNVEELESKFHEVLDQGLLPLKEGGYFSKYVLLIDEMDKLPTDEVLSFLSGNQRLFEVLYRTYGFVVFFAGHDSWVERIVTGTEYNYYQGKVFRIPPFVNPADVQRLVEVNLLQHCSILSSDIPLTERGYAKIQELTQGIPRRILLLVTSVMNEGVAKKTPRMGSSFVEEVSITEEHSARAVKYLEDHYNTVVKLKRAIEKKLDQVLYIFYNCPDHRLLKTLDTNLYVRTKTLGVEWTDAQWSEQVLSLVYMDCLENKDSYRELSGDIVGLFDTLSEHPTFIEKLVPGIVRKMKELKPTIEIAKLNYKDVIDSIFDISPSTWFSKEQILERFSDKSLVITIAAARRPRSLKEFIDAEFERAFESYLTSNDKNPKLIIASEKGEQLYRKLPANMSEDDKILLRLGNKELVEDYIGLVLDMKVCDHRAIDDVDRFLENMISLIGQPKKMEPLRGVIRTRKRHEIFDNLAFRQELKNRFDFYLRETKQACPSTEIVRETAKQIFRGLFELYMKSRSTSPPEQISISPSKPFTHLVELYELIGNLNGPLKILDKDFDIEGFKFFYKLDPSKVREVQILRSRSRLGQTLKEECKEFLDEMRNREIVVEIRILDEKDAIDIHDRYLISPEVVYNTPPWNVINKKLGDILRVENGASKTLYFDKVWSRSTNVLKIPIT